MILIDIYSSNPDKAKASVRRGRKASALISKMAELPKDRRFGKLGFLYGEKIPWRKGRQR